jgi:histidine triad (HIT) family protein
VSDGSTAAGCIFCAIVGRDVPAERLIDGPPAIAIRDIAPAAPTHVLVIPRRHITDAHALSTGDAELLTAMIETAQRVAESEGIAESGYRLVFNVGNDGGNTVAHLHLHVLGGRQMTWPPG